MKEKKRDLLICMGEGAVIALAVFLLNLSRGYPVTRCLCDGFFVASVLLLGLGGIKAVRNKGTFDVMGYGLKNTVETFLPFLKKDGDSKENIHQYMERKAAQRRGSAAMLIAGAVYFAVSLAALAVYHAVE